MENVELENKAPEVFDVLPLDKGKRILVFLADFFLNFILAFLLFTIAGLPLGKAFSGYTKKNSDYVTNLTERADILYENKILFNSKNVDRSNIIYNASFTYFCFLSYFCFEEENPTNVEYEQYGHKEENNIFRHYFIDIMKDEKSYISFFDLYNNNKSYFVRDNLTITLKSEYRSQIYPFFDKGDVQSKEADRMMEEIETTLFYPLYSEVMSSIEKNDLTYGDLSYVAVKNKITTFEKYVYNLAVGASLSSLLLSSAILYVLIPFLNKNKKTISMMIMKVERVETTSLDIIPKSKVVISFIYAFVSNMLISFFIPLGFLLIFELFNIPLLMLLGFLSIALMLASLVFLLVNNFNMDLFDYLTRFVYLKTDTLDDIYRKKGYYI